MWLRPICTRQVLKAVAANFAIVKHEKLVRMQATFMAIYSCALWKRKLKRYGCP